MPNYRLRSITLSRPYAKAYARFFAESSLTVMMRQTSDPMVMAGPLFQVTQPESGG